MMYYLIICALSTNFFCTGAKMNRLPVISSLLLTLLFSGSAEDILSLLTETDDGQGKYDKPLFLTPYIESGQIDEARFLAKNGPVNHTVSYSGFLTVNSTAFSNLFFLYFPAENDRNRRAPIAIWLKGSSVIDSMAQIGPYELDEDGNIRKREYSWNKVMNILFIDNPVGTGFSFTIGDDYATDQNMIGKYLLNAVKQFYELFPELIKCRLYISGQSYGGKYVPALAHAIHVHNQYAKQKINMWGIAIGNGLIDPVNQLVHGPHQFNLGLIDEKGLEEMEKLSSKIRKDVEAERWKEASAGFKHLFWNYEGEPPNLLYNNTGFKTPYNILVRNLAFTEMLHSFVQNPDIRNYLNVGRLSFQDGRLSESHLSNDLMKSVLPWFEEILSHYNVLLMSGQLDILVPYPATENFLKKMDYLESVEYAGAPRETWILNGDIAGYTKTVYHTSPTGKKLHFTHAMVRSAGHMVPMDQPQVAFEMMRRFTIKKKPF